MILVIWILGFIVGFSVICFRAGRLLRADAAKEQVITDTNNLLSIGFIFSLVWPLLLIVGCVISPFVGLYYLGVRSVRK